ncbi:hypothetical protein [uncultured Ilyobacter sp.]|uniref:hypothetical protein n=1 Tax=uncultured Ilyobacter sp. TaxID=544433 RepID=UPI0029F51493|nr:hypothetical protein [uncultured Ilyobacter sp.]
MPLDSLPLFKSLGTYVPYPSLICFILYLIPRSIKRYMEFKILIIILISFLLLLVSVFKGIEYGKLEGSGRYCIELTFFIISYLAFNKFFKKIKSEEKDKYIDTSLSIIYKFHKPFVIFMIFQIFTHLMLKKSILTPFLSSRFTLGRLQSFSGEPSWAARTLLILIFVAMIDKKDKIIQFTLLFLLFLTGSSLGILTYLIVIVLSKTERSTIKKTLTFFFMILFLYIVIQNTDSYLSSRIKELINYKNLLNTRSGSIAARIFFPINALYIGLNNFILGIGGGYYREFHYKFLFELFPQFETIPNIYSVGVTSKNLYTRLAAENGFIFLVFILSYLFILYYKVLIELKNQNRTEVQCLFILMILLNLNFDSLFYLYFIMLLSFFENLVRVEDYEENWNYDNKL